MLRMSELLTRIGWGVLPRHRHDNSLRRRINSVCRGYSRARHWHTFKRILAEHPHIRDVCMLGVYFGRDIAYLAEIFRQLERDFQIVGVDLFADVPGADWPGEKHALSWEEAGFGPPPSKEAAMANLRQLDLADHVELVQAPMQDFLRETERRFDFIYIDVAHDYETTVEAIRLAAARLRPGGLLGGDDFSNQGTWGVKRAVIELCPDYDLHHGWIWTACPDESLRAEAPALS